MEEEIKAEFTKNGYNFDKEEEVIQKCVNFCIQYNLSASDLVTSWEVYSLNSGLGTTVQSSHMGGFLDQLQGEKLKKIKEEQSRFDMYSDVNMMLDGDYEDMEVLPDTPADRPTPRNDKQYDSAERTKGSRSRLTSEKPLESVTPFGTRKTKFVVQDTLNNHVGTQAIKIEEDPVNTEDDIIKRVQPIKKCSLTINQSRPEPGCRFMYNRIEDTLDFLENRIKSRAAAFASSGLYGEPVDPSVARQKSIFAVGMICCEEEGRLREKPIMLQSSIEHSGGQRVRLELQNLDQFSIFPGQVVGVEGHNPSGHCLIASKIMDCVPLSDTLDEQSPAKRQATEQNLQIVNASHDTSELSLIVAAGPFTTSDNLLFEPLTELLAYACRKQPQLLVLLGPFVDSNHSQLNKVVNQTFDEMFQTEILEKLQDYVKYMGSAVQVILMPSIRDANNDLVFPQPRFDFHPSDFNNQIHGITNPGNFCANEVKVACCSVDILKQLSAEEINRKTQGGRLINLAKHILNQSSFYPLYPPAEDIPLDYSLSPESLIISSLPDILVLPSDLARFVTIISLDGNDGQKQHKCICVNPGRLARGEGGGFFAEINYKGSPDSSNASIIRI